MNGKNSYNSAMKAKNVILLGSLNYPNTILIIKLLRNTILLHPFPNTIGYKKYLCVCLLIDNKIMEDYSP